MKILCCDSQTKLNFLIIGEFLTLHIQVFCLPVLL